ncbi:unnamed protein product [Amoebophrya sp. A120]|nr:unnamed protein product [Amoebophrya sp. A120]|eukprot:GSA120T00005152001.1
MRLEKAIARTGTKPLNCLEDVFVSFCRQEPFVARLLVAAWLAVSYVLPVVVHSDFP